MSSETPIIEMRNIVKQFGGNRALDGAGLTVRRGEVHALLGDNGAGKSTLIKVLCGVHQADEGEILIEGEPVFMTSPRDASKHGIEVIHQDLALVDEFNAVDNMFLGREPRMVFNNRTVPIIDQQRMRQAARELLDRIRVNLPTLSESVYYLSGGQRQGVAIARALSHEENLKVLIMDEPTAALGVEETGKVLDLIRRLRDNGVTIVVISHNLHDVFDVADRATVMFGGSRAVDVRIAETTREDIVGYIMGAHMKSDGGGPRPTHSSASSARA